VAERTKVGFCMLDSGIEDATLPGAPASRYYDGSRCHEDRPQGISIGWYDVYTYNLPDQDIPIAGLPDGRYCLRVRLDPGDVSFPAPVGRIVEGNDDDNLASTKLQLAGSDVTELDGTC
jgi:hypothetical protein